MGMQTLHPKIKMHSEMGRRALLCSIKVQYLWLPHRRKKAKKTEGRATFSASIGNLRHRTWVHLPISPRLRFRRPARLTLSIPLKLKLPTEIQILIHCSKIQFARFIETGHTVPNFTVGTLSIFPFYTLAAGIKISVRSLQRSEGNVSDPIKYINS